MLQIFHQELHQEDIAQEMTSELFPSIPKNSSIEEQEEDDWENEKLFMLAEAENRELTEDERLLYNL
jgi:hypothetical protein